MRGTQILRQKDLGQRYDDAHAEAKPPDAQADTPEVPGECHSYGCESTIEIGQNVIVAPLHPSSVTNPRHQELGQQLGGGEDGEEEGRLGNQLVTDR